MSLASKNLSLLRAWAILTVTGSSALWANPPSLVNHLDEVTGRAQAQCPGGNCNAPVTAARLRFTNPRSCFANRNVVQVDLELQTATAHDALFGRLAPGSFIMPWGWTTASRRQMQCPQGQADPETFYAFNCFQAAQWRGVRTAADVLLTIGDVHHIFPGITPISIPFNYMFPNPILALNRSTANRICVNLEASYEQLVRLGRGQNSGPSQICAIRCLTREMDAMGWIQDGSDCASVRRRFQAAEYDVRTANACSIPAPLRTAAAPQAAHPAPPPVPQPPLRTDEPYCRCRCRMVGQLNRLLCKSISAVHPDQCLAGWRERPPQNSQDCLLLNGGSCEGVGWVGIGAPYRLPQTGPIAEGQPQPAGPPPVPSTEDSWPRFPDGWGQRPGLLDCTGAPSTDNHSVIRVPLADHGETPEDFISAPGGGRIVGMGRIEHPTPVPNPDEEVARNRRESNPEQPGRSQVGGETARDQVSLDQRFDTTFRIGGNTRVVVRNSGRMYYGYSEGANRNFQTLPSLPEGVTPVSLQFARADGLNVFAIGSNGHLYWLKPIHGNTGNTGLYRYPDTWTEVLGQGSSLSPRQFAVVENRDGVNLMLLQQGREGGPNQILHLRLDYDQNHGLVYHPTSSQGRSSFLNLPPALAQTPLENLLIRKNTGAGAFILSDARNTTGDGGNSFQAVPPRGQEPWGTGQPFTDSRLGATFRYDHVGDVEVTTSPPGSANYIF